MKFYINALDTAGTVTLPDTETTPGALVLTESVTLPVWANLRRCLALTTPNENPGTTASPPRSPEPPDGPGNPGGG